MDTRQKPESMIVSPGPSERTVKGPNGELFTVPKSWALLPPGDAGLTRRVKAATTTWTVQFKKGRKTFSQGVWADASTIEDQRKRIDAERSTEAYAKRRESDKVRRDKKQMEYVDDFETSVREFLHFHDRHAEIAGKLSHAVAEHATPVGSGTVARTQRIPIEERAEAAVIAWMRHQTTAYDNMKIARVKGERREVRRMLAERSRHLLEKYRRGDSVPADACPLQSALRRISRPEG